MRHIDVFNGDADGLCALRQLRLAEPAAALLVTGVKRDIGLLARVRAGAGDLVTVLDVSLDRNRADLLRLLESGARVRYYDHHYAGEVPAHPGLEARLDASGGLCTAMIVDRLLGGRFRPWAVAAAFGDGLDQAALDLGARVPLGPHALEQLRELGRSLNYNAYGESEADLHVPPAELYRVLAGYDDPLRFAIEEPLYARLDAGRRADLAAASDVEPYWTGLAGAIYVLPDADWSRRVSGTLAHQLAGQRAHGAIAVLTPRRDGAWMASLRVAAGARGAADEFCRGFPGGGGRREAAGIDRLPPAELDAFVSRFAAAFR
jgi:single-stranded DNA-specific DHH superfamily exonuclease